MKKIIIGRPINGIGLNGLEYLMDSNNKEMEFKDKVSVIDYLKQNGYEEFSEDDFEDSFIFKEIE